MQTSRAALRGTLISGCALAALAAGTSVATRAAAADATATTSSIQEVVVTAQRRSERLVNVPMSVSVVTPATLEKAGAQNIHDLGSMVAGAQVDFAGCCTQPSIRGVSTLTTGFGSENNVAVYVDGFYVPDNISLNSDLSNIASIEVLKGPQGALWGRNATGGAILINTLTPSRHFTGNFEVGGGRFNEWTTKGYISGPINERLRFSVAEASRLSDGPNTRIGPTGQVVDHRMTPITQVNVRAKVEADLTDWLTATVGYNYTFNRDARGQLFDVFQHESNSFFFPIRSTFHSTAPFTASYNPSPTLGAEVHEGTLKLAARTSIGVISSYTGYAHRDVPLIFHLDNTWNSYYIGAGDSLEDTFQQAIDYNITAIKNLNLVVGADYFDDHWKQAGNITYFGRLPLLVPSTAPSGEATIDYVNQSTKAYAFYIDGTYQLTSRISIDLGARYSNDKKGNSGARVSLVPAIFPPTPWHFQEKSFSAFTPRASVRFEVMPRSNVYFTYSEGYRSGGFNATTTDLQPPYDPEKIKSYELGFKTSQSWYTFDSALYYYDYSNLQVGVTLFLNGTVQNLVLNAKKAKIYGWDNEVTVRPIENLNLRAGVSLLHGVYKNFLGSNTGLNPVTDMNVTQLGYDFSGLRMVRAPAYSGFVGGDYEFPEFYKGSLLIAANANFTGSYPLSNPATFGPLVPGLQRVQRYPVAAHVLVNLEVKWTDPSKHFHVTLWGHNLADEHYRISFNGNATVGDYQSFADPLTYGVRAGWDF
jgi:iron complex outermembrane receptor protein